MARSRSPEQTAMYFVRYHLGKHAFAPLTGSDWRAWRAFVHLLEFVRRAVLWPKIGHGKIQKLHAFDRDAYKAALRRAKEQRAKPLPPCAVAMGCLCAGHARGDRADAPCDTSEIARKAAIR